MELLQKVTKSPELIFLLIGLFLACQSIIPFVGFILIFIGLSKMTNYNNKFRTAKGLALFLFFLSGFGLLCSILNMFIGLVEINTTIYNFIVLILSLVLYFLIIKGFIELNPNAKRQSKMLWYILLSIKIIVFIAYNIMYYTDYVVNIYPFMAIELIGSCFFAFFVLIVLKTAEIPPSIAETKTPVKSSTAFSIVFFVLIVIWILLLVPSGIAAMWSPMMGDGLSGSNVTQEQIKSTYLIMYSFFFLPVTILVSIISSTICYITKYQKTAAILVAVPILHIIFLFIVMYLGSH